MFPFWKAGVLLGIVSFSFTLKAEPAASEAGGQLVRVVLTEDVSPKDGDRCKLEVFVDAGGSDIRYADVIVLAASKHVHAIGVRMTDFKKPLFERSNAKKTVCFGTYYVYDKLAEVRSIYVRWAGKWVTFTRDGDRYRWDG